MPETTAAVLAAPLMHRLKESFPYVEVIVDVHDSAHLTKSMRVGDIDFAVIHGPATDERLFCSGLITNDVLDAGCGHGEVSLALGAAGYTVVGLELADTAVAWAQRSAATRGLHNATFAQADTTAFSGYDDRFSSVVDCTLFHALPVDQRDAYLPSVHRSAVPGADYYIYAEKGAVGAVRHPRRPRAARHRRACTQTDLPTRRRAHRPRADHRATGRDRGNLP